MHIMRIPPASPPQKKRIIMRLCNATNSSRPTPSQSSPASASAPRPPCLRRPAAAGPSPPPPSSTRASAGPEYSKKKSGPWPGAREVVRSPQFGEEAAAPGVPSPIHCKKGRPTRLPPAPENAPALPPRESRRTSRARLQPRPARPHRPRPWAPSLRSNSRPNSKGRPSTRPRRSRPRPPWPRPLRRRRC